MVFFAYVGIGFTVVTVGSIVSGLVRGLIARHKFKKAVKEFTGTVRKGVSIHEVSEEK